jgi:hypothetical protein
MSLSLGAFEGSQSTVLAVVAADDDSCGRSCVTTTVGALKSVLIVYESCVA